MQKVVVFDADGMLVLGTRFSTRLESDFGIPLTKTLPFFTGVLKSCQVGEADLKVELGKVVGEWGWSGTVEDLMREWFTSSKLDERFIPIINALRARGVGCFLATNNEKYRVEYLSDTMGLGKILDGIYSSANTGAMKTTQKFVDRLASDSALSPNNIIYYDDRAEHIAILKEMGVDARLYIDFESFEVEMRTLLTALGER